jgi:hypothetical protein
MAKTKRPRRARPGASAKPRKAATGEPHYPLYGGPYHLLGADLSAVSTAVRSPVQPPAPAWPIPCSWATSWRSASSSAADW